MVSIGLDCKFLSLGEKVPDFRPRKVLLLAPYCDGTDVGEAWSTFQWVRRLAEVHKVTLITFRKRGRASAVQQLPEVKVIEGVDFPLVGRFERFNSILKPSFIGYYVFARQWIKNAISRGERFDIAHQLAPLALRYPSPATGLQQRLIVGPLGGSIPTPRCFKNEVSESRWYLNLRNLDRFRLAYDPLLRESYSSPNVILGVAPYVKDLLGPISVKRFEIASETAVDELPTSRDLEELARAKPLRLLFVGRVIRTKGVRDAVRALGLVRDLKHVELDIVGDGDDLIHCRREAENLGLSGKVHFHGRLPRSRVTEFYRHASVFLFPSFREPSGNVVFEAMSHGLAMIVASVGGPGYVVSDACGIRIAPISPTQYASDIAEAIRRLDEDRMLLSEFGAAARRTVAQKHLWSARIDQICRLYEEICDARP